MVDNNMENNEEDKIREAEIIMAEEQIAEDKEFIQQEEIKKEGKVLHFIKVILVGLIDQVLALALALTLFGLSGVILRVAGFRIVENMKEAFFLITYVTSNVLYYPLMAEIIHGKTLGRKLIFR